MPLSIPLRTSTRHSQHLLGTLLLLCLTLVSGCFPFDDHKPDRQPPRLELADYPATTQERVVTLVGRAWDDETPGRQVSRLHLQGEDLDEEVVLDGKQFQVRVALKPGVNHFTLTAEDGASNHATRSVTIRRIALPTLTLLNPPSGSEVTTDQITVRGTVGSDWSPEKLSLDVQDTASRSADPIALRSGELSSYSFELTLPAVGAGLHSWVFTVHSPDGDVTTTWHVLRRADVPTETGNLEWTLDATPPAVTASAKWTFSGRVTDEQGSSEGISLQLLGSTSAQAVQIAVDQQGHFQQPVDLAAGANGFTLVASKSGYASRSVQYAIRRYALPELKILSPENGAQTSDESITVNGEIRTAWPLARLGLLANGQPITLLPLADQVYRFSLPFGLPELGLNTLRLQLASPDGEVTHVLQLYRSDKQEPVTALRLSLDPPPDVATEAASIELAGRVVDAQGNSDGITLQLLSAQRSEVVNLTPQAGGAFRQTVALSPGSNGFTLLATKPGYGSAHLSWAITRHSPPKWLSLQPASGTHTRLAELSIEGRIATAWRAPQLQLLFQGQPQALRVAGEDLIFQIPLVALQAGDNRMQFSLVSPEGVQNLDYLLVRDADEPTVDKTPPLLTIQTVANQLTGDDHLLISGLVQDPPPDASGVKKVLLSNEAFAGIVLTATIRGDQFQADMPLNSGPNHIRIQAFDEADNRASADILVTRAKAPRFTELVPASGTVLTTSETGLTGIIECDAGDTLERLSINDSGLSFVKVGENQYRFSADAVTLQPGSNLIELRADTRLSRGEASHDLIYRPADDELLPKPTLTLLAPADQSMVQGDSVHLKVQVTSAAGKPKVTVDGQRYTLPMTGRSSSDGIYSALIDTQVAFAEGEDQLDVKIEAVDVLDKQAQLALRFYRDNRVPVITLSGYAPAPAVNPVASNPVQLMGTVNDDNLANLLINEQPVTLTPSGQGDDYQFVARFNLQPGETLPVNLVARDLGGNKARQSYLFQSQASVVLEPVLPLDDATLMTNGQPLTVQVVASIANLPAGALVQVQLAGGETMTLPHAGTLASGDITLPARTGAQELTYQVVANQVVLASAKRQVNIIDQASIPLTMLKSEPLNNQTNLEPDVPIVLYFNKSLDLTKLKFELRETLHGQTYVNRDSSGADFLQAKGYVLESVNRDQELVPVSASLLPDGQTVAFYLQRPLGFGAEAYVDVSYAGKEILRSRYQVRPLPTFIFGSIFDQFNQPLAGVEVSLPELGRTTQTNTEGAFSFGFQEAAGQEIPSGRYRLLINSTLSYSGFGSRRQLVSVVGATRNDLAVVRLSQLNPESPFMAVSSGQQKASFAGGELELDLSSARLLFPDSRDQGRLQVQFYPFEQLDSSTMPGVVPLWAYGSQPRGVAVEGTVGIRMRMPALNGGYDYLPEGTERVVLVAFDPQREVLTPIGIGRIENHMVISEGKLPLQSLDYLGYVVPDPSLQPQLSAVASGQQSLVTLVAQMAASGNGG